MKRVLKIIRNILIVLFLVFSIVSAFIIFKGHSMYSDALKKVSLEDKVEEIRSKSSYIKLKDMPKDYINATIAVEDHRFYDHTGIDFISLARAVIVNISNHSLLQGGSTITQQLAKNLYFTQEQDFSRKVAEVFMANELEDKYSKDDILELYLNTIYFGDGYYGIGKACKGYFNKEPKDMTLYESTLIAGVPNAPSIYAPTANMKLCLERQKRVVNAMIKNGFLDDATAKIILDEQPKTF